ncbi:unnamed protein product [Mesocestoides corti]|uniref:DUF4283 domain-containing protein n=1 Tax=Mesocestoides corti TaxID=53468 RepID=A0A0R3UFQ8_MESCO|nr:unnamed protein product [Mesocestoides corti]
MGLYLDVLRFPLNCYCGKQGQIEAAVFIVNPKLSAIANLPLLTPPTPLVLAANSSTLHIAGSVMARVMVDSIQARHSFLVSPDCQWNVILRYDFLSAHKGVIDCPRAKLIVYNWNPLSQWSTLTLSTLYQNPPTSSLQHPT